MPRVAERWFYQVRPVDAGRAAGDWRGSLNAEVTESFGLQSFSRPAVSDFRELESFVAPTTDASDGRREGGSQFAGLGTGAAVGAPDFTRASSALSSAVSERVPASSRYSFASSGFFEAVKKMPQ